MVAVYLREYGCTLQEAMDKIGTSYAGIKQAFCDNYNNLPSTGDETVDELVKEYCYGMGIWVTTNIKWSFASERYFGKQGLEVMKHRTVTLKPRKTLS